MRKLLVAALTAASMVTALAFVAGPAGATKPDPEHKVGICHRTASDSNPYVYIEVDEAAADPDGGHLGNNDPGHKPTYWKTDGTFRGVDHVAGDPKDDYLAPNGASDCQDGEEPPPPVADGAAAVVAGDCDSATVVSAENLGDVALTLVVIRDGEVLVNQELGAGDDYSAEFVTDSGQVDEFIVELWDGDSQIDEASGTADLTDCIIPPEGEASAALVQGTCDAQPVVVLTNDTEEAVIFVVNGTEVEVAALSEQSVEVEFGAVLVTTGEETLIDEEAVAPQGCNTTPPPPDDDDPPSPNGLPETL